MFRKVIVSSDLHHVQLCFNAALFQFALELSACRLTRERSEVHRNDCARFTALTASAARIGPIVKWSPMHTSMMSILL